MEPNLKALIIVDEERARNLLHKLLEETLCFMDIRMSYSADAALIELKHFEPDIILLDIKMPGKDGFEFINELPPGLSKTEIVFVTAYDQFAIKAIKNHAFDYLLKPVNRMELKQCVEKLLEKKNHSKIMGVRQNSHFIVYLN